MIVYEVYKIKNRGTVVVVQDPEIIPSIGDVVYSGDDSWIVRGVEKSHTGCFSFRADGHKTYCFLLQAIGDSREPIPTLMLNLL